MRPEDWPDCRGKNEKKVVSGVIKFNVGDDDEEEDNDEPDVGGIDGSDAVIDSWIANCSSNIADERVLVETATATFAFVFHNLRTTYNRQA